MTLARAALALSPARGSWGGEKDAPHVGKKPTWGPVHAGFQRLVRASKRQKWQFPRWIGPGTA